LTSESACKPLARLRRADMANVLEITGLGKTYASGVGEAAKPA
jgi:hypothetical protein